MRLSKNVPGWFAGRFYCTEEEYKKFLIYVDLSGATWENALRLDGGYTVLNQEESVVLEFIKLMENK